MLGKLIKFVVRTRFSRPLLALVAFFLIYETAIGSLTTGSGTSPYSGGFSYYAVGASIFFMVMSLLFGGLFVLKSDRDYLLTLPLSRRELSLSLFIAQFIGSGITVLFLYGFYVPLSTSSTDTILLIADLALLSCVVTALSVVANILSNWQRVALAIGLAAWSSTSLLGFPFTPVSSFTGNLLYGSIAILLTAVVFVPLALRELAYIELGSVRSLLRSTGSEYKKTMSFSGRSQIRAIYSYHLSFLELVGRMNIGGSTSYRTTRIKTSTVLIISVVASAAYLILNIKTPLGGFLPGGISYSPIVFVLPILLGAVVLALMSQGTFSNERGWLAFTAMDPATYLRHLLLSRALSTLAIIGPFGVADLLLGFLGNASAVNAAIVLLATVPAASMISAFLVARVGAVQQVKEEGMMPGQFDVRQFVAILPVYLVIGLIIVSELFLTAALVIALSVGVLAILLLSRAEVWRGIASRLTERGFI
jgi:hypothetical protein